MTSTYATTAAESDATTVAESESRIDVKKRRPSIVGDPSDSSVSRISEPGTSGGVTRDYYSYTAPEVLERPTFTRNNDRFVVLDNWEGVVTTVEADRFFASMRCSNSEVERAEDEFEIDMDNVARGDRELVQSGAVFYLTVGIRHPRGEGPQKTTRLIFRRMPRWSSRDIARAEIAAEELWKKLHSDEVAKTTGPRSGAS